LLSEVVVQMYVASSIRTKAAFVTPLPVFGVANPECLPIWCVWKRNLWDWNLYFSAPFEIWAPLHVFICHLYFLIWIHVLWLFSFWDYFCLLLIDRIFFFLLCPKCQHFAVFPCEKCLFPFLWCPSINRSLRVLLLVFWNKVLLCIPGWTRTLGPPALASWVLGLQVCTTTPSF
jgi:hypothetical protein